jgi:hypothetical protein
MSRLPGPPRLLVALLVLAALQAAGLFIVREASASASGCSRFSAGKAGKNPNDNLPDCLQGGSGCYECAYAHTNQSGYDICAEDTNGDGIEDCTLNVSSFPSWWPDPDPGLPAPEPPPGPGDIPDNGTGTGDDTGGLDPGAGGGGGGGDGGPYYYVAYIPPSYLYPVAHHRPYNPDAS